MVLAVLITVCVAGPSGKSSGTFGWAMVLWTANNVICNRIPCNMQNGILCCRQAVVANEFPVDQSVYCSLPVDPLRERDREDTRWRTLFRDQMTDREGDGFTYHHTTGLGPTKAVLRGPESVQLS